MGTGNQFPDDVLEGDGFRLSALDHCRNEVTQRWLPLPVPYTPDVARAFIEGTAPGCARAVPAW